MKVVSSRAGIVQRSKGQSIIASAAYISHTKMRDATTGETFYFRQRAKNEVRYHHVYLCDGAPQEFSDPEVLWNDLLRHENKTSRATTAQLARKFRVCFPQGMTIEKEIDLVDQFCESLTKKGMMVQAVIHDKADGNPHCHMLMTMRKYKDGKWQAKTKKVYDLDDRGNRIPLIDKHTGLQKIDNKGRKQWKCHKEHCTNWDRKDQVEQWRKHWAELCNQNLSNEQKLTEKSYKDQGIEKIPKKHEGWKVRQIVAAGGSSEIREYNDLVDAANAEIRRSVTEEHVAKIMIGSMLRRAEDAQEKRNEQLRNIAALYGNSRRTGEGIGAPAENGARNIGQRYQDIRFDAEIRRPAGAIIFAARAGIRKCQSAVDALRRASAVGGGQRRDPKIRRKDEGVAATNGIHADEGVGKIYGRLLDIVRRATRTLRRSFGVGRRGQENPEYDGETREFNLEECTATETALKRTADDAQSNDGFIRSILDKQQAAKSLRSRSRDRRPTRGRTR